MLPGRLSNPYPDASLSWERQEQTHVGRLTGGGLQVQIQVVRLDDSYRRYPTQPAQVELRYPPLPDSVEMTVPTAEAAAAMKLNAWADRSAPRDLVDLWALDREGHLTSEAVRIADEVAPGLVQPHSFGDDVEPSEQEWRAALAAQMPDPPDPRAVLHEVRANVAVRKGWRQGDHWKVAAEAFGDVDADDHR